MVSPLEAAGSTGLRGRVRPNEIGVVVADGSDSQINNFVSVFRCFTFHSLIAQINYKNQQVLIIGYEKVSRLRPAVPFT
jgi:hypothetical protein